MKETLTYSEWMVMSALWSQRPQTLSDVIKAMGDTMGWSYRTICVVSQQALRKGACRLRGQRTR